MKHFKRAAAMLLAVVLSLCLAVTAFAEGTAEAKGSLTVTGPGLTGKTVTAVRMFTANANTNAETNFEAGHYSDAEAGPAADGRPREIHTRRRKGVMQRETDKRPTQTTRRPWNRNRKGL